MSNLDKHFKILVVEDSQDLLNLWKAFFKSQNCEGIFCRDIQTAKTHLQNGFIPDILMTDYFLPDGTGEDLANELCDVYPQLKFLFVTGNQEIEIRKRAESIGKVLIKPVRFKTLNEVLKEVL